MHPGEFMVLKLCWRVYYFFVFNTSFNSDILILEIYVAASNSPWVSWPQGDYFHSWRQLVTKMSLSPCPFNLPFLGQEKEDTPQLSASRPNTLYGQLQFLQTLIYENFPGWWLCRGTIYFPSGLRCDPFINYLQQIWCLFITVI